MSDVLLDGKPMTREALVAAWKGKLPHIKLLEFDVAEGLLDGQAEAIARWCDREGIEVEIRYQKVNRKRFFTDYAGGE